MIVRDMVAALEELAPPKYAQEWDNVGLLVGNPEDTVTKVLVTLDVTSKALERAVATGATMIIAHHPVIFHKLSSVTTSSAQGVLLYEMIRRGISCYAMHTNFDVMGMGDALADELGLLDRKVLQVTYDQGGDVEGLGRLGRLPYDMSLQECAEYVRDILSVESVRMYGDLQTRIHTMAIYPGSGAEAIAYAQREGADVLVTGDIKHHDALEAMEEDLTIIDAGHYGTEKLFMEVIREFLKREHPDISVVAYDTKEPYRTIIS